MTHLKLVLLVAAGLVTSVTVNLVVGLAWGYWSVARRRPPETVIHYVKRVRPAPSAVPAAPRDELTAH